MPQSDEQNNGAKLLALGLAAVIVLGICGVAVKGLGTIFPQLKLPSFDTAQNIDKPNPNKPAAHQRAPADVFGAKILGAAKRYDDEQYVWGGGHPPQEYRRGQGLDCSGLINVAVMQATGVKENQVASSFRSSKHWHPIPMSQAQVGDIMYRLQSRHRGDRFDHVVIVVSNKGAKRLTVFEAKTQHGPRSKQIRTTTSYTYSWFDGALRYGS